MYPSRVGPASATRLADLPPVTGPTMAASRSAAAPARYPPTASPARGSHERPKPDGHHVPGPRAPATPTGSGRAPAHRSSNGARAVERSRRPPARGRLAGSAWTGEEYELGSVWAPGSKKANLNHLLNFQYEPRGFHPDRRVSRPLDRGLRRPGGRLARISRPKYNKEHYLQANCQFVVQSRGDYSAHLVDPDSIVDWALIEQVGLKTSDVPSCPICLYPPTAAKMARCGHIFCWSCILHYLALSDYPSRDCPICFVAIFKADLKSVVSLLHSDHMTGATIEMRLMRRERNSLFAVPVAQYHPAINEQHPAMSVANNTYSQLLLASPSEVAAKIIARERHELEEQYRNDRHEPEVCFIEEALHFLQEREDMCARSNMVHNTEEHRRSAAIAQNERKASPPIMLETASPAGEQLIHFEGENPCRTRHASSGSDGTSSVDMDNGGEVMAEDLDLFNLQPANIQANEKDSAPVLNGGRIAPKDTFFFYQSADGQPIYLHALNVQMLVKEYGSFEKCPPIIKGNILEKDSTSMNEELRNKLRYLRHLPITCIFEVCELELIDPRVSKSTQAAFKDQLDLRHRKRSKRARDELRREKKIQLEEDKWMGKFPGAKIRIESDFHFPQVGRISGPSRVQSNLKRNSLLRKSEESLTSVESMSSSPMSTNLHGSPSSQLYHEPSMDGTKSFANMLRQSASRSGPTGGQGGALHPAIRRSDTFPASNFQKAENHSDSEPEPEGYVPRPPQAKLGDSLAQALEQFSLQKGAGQGNFEASKAQGSKKKKGKKMKGTTFSLAG